MIVFNELRVLNDSSKLIIEVSVNGDQLIDQIWIDTKVPIYRGACPTMTTSAYLVASIDDPLYKEDIDKFKAVIIPEGKRTHLRLELDREPYEENINFPAEMCHVYVLYTGETEECRCNPSMRTVVNFYPYYQLSIYYMKELSQECKIPRDLIDFILRIKSVEMALKTGNYAMAHELWEGLKKLKTPPYKSCNCPNGILY